MKRLQILIGTVGVATGVGLIVAGMASNGFHSCGTGGTYHGDPEPTNPCPHSTTVLVVAGIIVLMLGILLPFGIYAVMRLRARARNDRPGSLDDQRNDVFGP